AGRDDRLAPGLTKLAVFAAAAVIAAEGRLLAVTRLLAFQAQPHSGNRFPPRLGDLGRAFGAMRQARTLRQAALRATDPILDGCVDLLLYRAVSGPTCRHVLKSSVGCPAIVTGRSNTDFKGP